MSIRSSGAGNLLTAAAAWGVGTGAFSIGFWVKLISDRNTYVDFVGFAPDPPPPANYFSLGTAVDGTTPTLYATSLTDLPTTQSLTVGSWYYIVLSRTSTTARLRIFDDSTSTVPTNEVTATASGWATDWSAYDNFIVGEMFANEWIDAEFRNIKVHNGVEWTNAQCRTESQTAGIQTAGGTPWGAWDLQDIDADATGINDLTGNSRHFTNTGFVNGASEPAQMSSEGITSIYVHRVAAGASAPTDNTTRLSTDLGSTTETYDDATAVRGESYDYYVELVYSDATSVFNVTAANVTVPFEAPVATIDHPVTGTISEGMQLALSGTATAVGGSISSRQWSSNVDGVLGTADDLQVVLSGTDASPVTHTLTYTVTDINSLSDSDTVIITVGINGSGSGFDVAGYAINALGGIR